MKKSRIIFLVILMVILVAGISPAAQFNPEISSYMKELEKQARQEDPSFKGFEAERGKKIFSEEQPHKDNKNISCTTCHTKDIKKQGKNARTGKLIEPLAPSVNKKRLTSSKDVEKWIRRNFKDVYGREGTATEKGDVLTFINSN